MGSFGSRKTKSIVGNSHVIGFLDKADDAYVLAFDSKNIKPFVPCTDPAVCTVILQEILSGEGRYLGTSKFRKRSWETALDDEHAVRAAEHVGYEAINCDHGLSIPLGDQVSQEWDVSVGGIR